MASDDTTEEERIERAGVPLIIQVLSMVAGIAIIAGLLVYSLHDVLTHSRPETPSRSVVVASTPFVRGTPIPFVFNGPTEAPGSDILLLLLMCEGEEVATAIYGGPIYESYVSLESVTDHDLIADYLAGRPTMFPKVARTFKSACFQKAEASGEFR